jgi:hypothetical protein
LYLFYNVILFGILFNKLCIFNEECSVDYYKISATDLALKIIIDNNTLVELVYVIYFLNYKHDVRFTLHFVYVKYYIIFMLIFYIDLLLLFIIASFIHFLLEVLYLFYLKMNLHVGMNEHMNIYFLFYSCI